MILLSINRTDIFLFYFCAKIANTFRPLPLTRPPARPSRCLDLCQSVPNLFPIPTGKSMGCRMYEFEERSGRLGVCKGGGDGEEEKGKRVYCNSPCALKARSRIS